mgnify:CR=1 FL=1
MNQAAVRYRYNEQPSRGLAVAGMLFFLPKAILLIPHAIILSVLGWLASIVAWIGFWIVAFTGRMPEGISSLLDMDLRWVTRTTGWFAGITDAYPPFETDPAGYAFDATTPQNENPSRGWAVAGITWVVKSLALFPHFIMLFILYIGVIFGVWFGFVQAAFTGRLSTAIQDYVAGTAQWYLRVMAWFYGLTDEYPPFSMQIGPEALPTV